jgi:YebC/PmpR family DNA-binding regulatory protein
MSGHSHWSGIKHKKEAADAKRGKVFSKLLKAIGVAARTEPNPDFNPRLRTAIMKAKEAQVPVDNIDRAVAKASQTAEALEELLFEAYGASGSALLIESVTDNRNRAVQEVKKILAAHDAKWATPGSVQWAFEDGRAKFPQKIADTEVEALQKLVEALEDSDEVQRVVTNAEMPGDEDTATT